MPAGSIACIFWGPCSCSLRGFLCLILLNVLLVCLLGPVWHRGHLVGERGSWLFCFRWFIMRVLSNVLCFRWFIMRVLSIVLCFRWFIMRVLSIVLCFRLVYYACAVHRSLFSLVYYASAVHRSLFSLVYYASAVHRSLFSLVYYASAVHPSFFVYSPRTSLSAAFCGVSDLGLHFFVKFVEILSTNTVSIYVIVIFIRHISFYDAPHIYSHRLQNNLQPCLFEYLENSR